MAMQFEAAVSKLAFAMLDIAKENNLDAGRIIRYGGISDNAQVFDKRQLDAIDYNAFVAMFGAMIHGLGRASISPSSNFYCPDLPFKYFAQVHAFSDSLLDAHHRAQELSTYLASDFSSFAIELVGEEVHFVRCTFDQEMDCDRTRRLVTIYHALWLYWWLRTSEWLIGRYIEIESAGFSYLDEELVEVLEALLRCRVDASEKNSSIVINKSVIDRSIVRTKFEFELMTSNPVYVFQNIDAFLHARDYCRGGNANSVKQLLQDMNGQAYPNLDVVAQSLGLSKATLQRRLKKENTNYQEIKDLCRMYQAMRLLIEGSHPLDEISSQVGFSNASSFYKAVKRWTGRAPIEWRERIRSAE